MRAWSAGGKLFARSSGNEAPSAESKMEEVFLINLSYPVSTQHFAQRNRRTELLGPDIVAKLLKVQIRRKFVTIEIREE